MSFTEGRIDSSPGIESRRAHHTPRGSSGASLMTKKTLSAFVARNAVLCRCQVSHQADLAGHEGPVWQVSWGHPKFGGILASCSFDHRVIIWKELAEGVLATGAHPIFLILLSRDPNPNPNPIPILPPFILPSG